MTAPRFVDCACTHSKEAHEVIGLEPQCTARACSCIRYRPATAPAAVRPAMPAPATVIRPPAGGVAAPADSSTFGLQLIADAKKSDNKRIVAKAEKIDALLTELRDQFAADQSSKAERAARERAQVAAREEITRLEQLLAEKKAALKRTPQRPRASSAGSGVTHSCPDCPREFTGAQGLAVHMGRAHGVSKAG